MAKKVKVDILNDDFLWKIFTEVQAALENASNGYQNAINEDKTSRLSNRFSKKAKFIVHHIGPGGYVYNEKALSFYRKANADLIVVLEAVIHQIRNQQAKLEKDKFWETPLALQI